MVCGLSLGTTQFVVTAAGNTYGSWSDACTTGTTAPTSTTYGTLFGDGTCSLVYQGNIGYSSKANILPHQLTPYHIGGVPAGVSQYSWHSYLKLWWGGAARPEYVDGANGELTQITLGWHFSSPSDGGVVNKPPGSYGLVSATSGYDLAQEIMAAPGNGFGDNMNPTSGPLRYDPTKGVAAFSSQPAVVGPEANPANKGMAVSDCDFLMRYSRLQLKSTTWAAWGHAGASPCGYNGNGSWIRDSIVDAAGSWAGGQEIGTGSMGANDLIIERGTGTIPQTSPYIEFAGSSGHYGETLYSSTVIGPGISACLHCAGVATDRHSQYGPICFKGSCSAPFISGNGLLMNNLFFGFGQGFQMAAGSANWLDYGLSTDGSGNVVVYAPGSTPPCPGADCNAGNNGTDLPSSYTGIVGYNFTQPGGSGLATSIPYPPYP